MHPIRSGCLFHFFSRHQRSLAISFLSLLALILYWYASVSGNHFIYLNVTASLPRGIYISIPGTAYRDEDFVVYRPTDSVREFSLSRGYMKKETEMSFLKQIGAQDGESWEADSERNFIIKGKTIGTVLPKDSKGIEMPIPYGKHIVPEGEFLPYTKALKSFDGRYEGTVPKNRIITRVVPLLTE